MKKKFAFVIALLLSSASLMAQKNVETVYLKNGSVIRGTIIEQVPGQSLKVQTKDGSVFVYQMDEVERIAKEVQSTTSASVGQYGHGHRGLDFTMEGGVAVGKGGNASGVGGIELGKRFNQNFYWGVGLRVSGGGSSDVQIPITTTFKALFPVTSSGIAPNIALRTGFVANTDEIDEYDSRGRYTGSKSAHGWEIGLMPGIQIPLGQKVDFNLNLGYQCNVIFGVGAGHAFAMNGGFGFHKPYTTDVNRVVRPRFLQYTIDGAVGFGSNSLIHGGPALVFSYKCNPNISVGVGYRIGILRVNQEQDGSYDGGRREFDDWGLVHSVFLRGQYRMLNKTFSPLASADIGFRKYGREGYSGGVLYGEKKLGFLFSPAVGVSCKASDNSYIEFKVGYNCTSALEEGENYSGWWGEKVSLGDFFLSLGFTHDLKWGSYGK